MEIIACHLNADFDCLAGLIGARKLYPEAIPVMPGSAETKVRQFLDQFNPIDILSPSEIDLQEVKKIIVVDTSSPERLGPLQEVLSSPGVRVHLYDHHWPTNPIKAELQVVEPVGATATIFAEILKDRQIYISPLEATVLCLGIYEETGSLRFPTTTERDLYAVAYLLKRGANLNIVSQFLRIELSKEDLALLNDLISGAKVVEHRGLRIMVAKAVRQHYIIDAAGLAHRIMDMEDIDALVVLIEMEGKTILIGRSRVSEFDVTCVLSEFGGGGHPSAGSAKVEGTPLELIEETVLKKIPKCIRPEKLVRHVMTFPVITTSHRTTIKETETLMTRYGVNVLPVLKEGKYYGIITREVVEKALMHGFGRSPVSDFTTTDAIVVGPDTALEEAEQKMIEANQRFLPVVQDHRVVGCITRTDLLRNLYEEHLKRQRLTGQEHTEPGGSGRNLRALMREKFPPFVYKILQEASRVAESLGYRAYLVGGSVRDLLMGKRNLDIDIVVEGDGIVFAKALSEALGGPKVITHKKFNTAKLIFYRDRFPESPEDRYTVDIATARTEYYESPASLPVVETSSLKKDLYRRDFTINTLAVDLSPQDFGKLIDFFGGQRDIKEGTIRVLHNLSFIEDPTRALRAVRFAERFGFSISRHTEKLIKTAVRLNLFDKLQGTRLYDELRLLWRETDPVKAIQRLQQYDLLRAIHPALDIKSLQPKFESIKETLTWFELLYLEEEISPDVLYFAAMAEAVPEGQREDFIRKLKAPAQAQRLINICLDTVRTSRFLRLKEDNPVATYYALKGLPTEAVLHLMASSKEPSVRKAISRYLLQLRHTKASLTGKDLIKLGFTPGPVFSRILQDLLEEKLKGTLKTKEQEQEFVLKHYGQHLRNSRGQ